MRDHIQVAQQILEQLNKTKANGTRKREFMQQLNNFIKDTRFYPPEARYPWDKLGHLAREYCHAYGQDKLHDWQRTTLAIIRGESYEEITTGHTDSCV